MLGSTNKQKAVRAYRGQIPSPGRPTVAWRQDRVRFWAAIARGDKTEDAAVAANAAWTEERDASPTKWAPNISYYTA